MSFHSREETILSGPSGYGNLVYTPRWASQVVRRLFMLANWNVYLFSGTPLLGPDGNPLVMQPSYQQVMVKPGSTAGYTPPSSVRASVQGAQQPTAIAQQQQQQQQQQQPAVNSGQIVMPQYVGVPQPMYVMPTNGRPPYAQQQAVSFPNQFPSSSQVYSLSRDFSSLSFKKL